MGASRIGSHVSPPIAYQTNYAYAGGVGGCNSSTGSSREQGYNSSPSLGSSSTGVGANSSPSSSSTAAEQLSRTNLYIRGLTPNTTDKDLEELCRKYGTIISTKAILDKNTNKCKGYGFVDFESPQAAESAVKALQLQGIQAQMAKQQEQDPTNLYLANLPAHVTEQDLHDMLYKYGTVISTRVLRDGGSQSRGVGFARFVILLPFHLVLCSVMQKLDLI